MNEKVQDKINQVQKLAKSSVEASSIKSNGASRSDDSLSKAIRNSQEAAVFLAELNAAITISKK